MAVLTLWFSQIAGYVVVAVLSCTVLTHAKRVCDTHVVVMLMMHFLCLLKALGKRKRYTGRHNLSGKTIVITGGKLTSVPSRRMPGGFDHVQAWFSMESGFSSQETKVSARPLPSRSRQWEPTL